jgi:hypothetical protein
MMIATVLGTASRELEEVEMAFPFSEEVDRDAIRPP